MNPVIKLKPLSGIIRSSIGANNTSDIDIMDYSDFCNVHYVICITDFSKTLFSSFQMFGSKKNSDVIDTVYSKLGDAINISVKFIKSGSDTILRIDNNESFVIDVKVIKTITN